MSTIEYLYKLSMKNESLVKKLPIYEVQIVAPILYCLYEKQNLKSFSSPFSRKKDSHYTASNGAFSVL